MSSGGVKNIRKAVSTREAELRDIVQGLRGISKTLRECFPNMTAFLEANPNRETIKQVAGATGYYQLLVIPDLVIAANRYLLGGEMMNQSPEEILPPDKRISFGFTEKWLEEHQDISYLWRKEVVSNETK
jgi:hypothetical protein